MVEGLLGLCGFVVVEGVGSVGLIFPGVFVFFPFDIYYDVAVPIPEAAFLRLRSGKLCLEVVA